MKTMPCVFYLVLFCSLILVSGAHAQWPDDPAVNLAIADRPAEQVVPKIASTSDGGCYVCWFDLASGNYDVYLQHLDNQGNEVWEHNGILVSDNPQNSSLVDWDLIADSQDNAVIVFTDARNGSDLDVYAYKVSPAGDQLWGVDGVTISVNDDFEPSPVVAEASDGDIVVVWARLPDVGDGSLMMQRLSPAGVERFAVGGIPVETQPGESPGFAQIIPGVDGNVIVSWVRDISTFFSLRHVRANMFDATGSTVWTEPVNVFDAGSVPIAHWPRMVPDGNGGAVVYWHYSSAAFNCHVQRLDADGNELFPHNGQTVSTSTTMNHLDPALAYNQGTGESIVFWNERNLSQTQWGIYAQKLSATGVRMWGNTGLVLLPVSTLYRSFPRCAPYADGAMVYLTDEPTGMFDEDRVIGMRLDGDGNHVWPGEILEVSTVPSEKSRLPITIDTAGVVKLIWEDGRNGNRDVYGQNVNPDGTLGPAVTAVGEGEGEGEVAGDEAAPSSRILLPNFPNPFNPQTSISFRLDRPRSVRISVSSLSGQQIAVLTDQQYGAGMHSVAWNGKDGLGRAVASGTYLVRLEAEAAVEMQKIMLVR
jgi:hypothetical protein